MGQKAKKGGICITRHTKHTGRVLGLWCQQHGTRGMSMEQVGKTSVRYRKRSFREHKFCIKCELSFHMARWSTVIQAQVYVLSMRIYYSATTSYTACLNAHIHLQCRITMEILLTSFPVLQVQNLPKCQCSHYCMIGWACHAPDPSHTMLSSGHKSQHIYFPYCNTKEAGNSSITAQAMNNTRSSSRLKKCLRVGFR